MAKQFKGWKDEDGGIHNTELQALRADAKVWEKRAREAGFRKPEGGPGRPPNKPTDPPGIPAT